MVLAVDGGRLPVEAQRFAVDAGGHVAFAQGFTVAAFVDRGLRLQGSYRPVGRAGVEMARSASGQQESKEQQGQFEHRASAIQGGGCY